MCEANPIVSIIVPVYCVEKYLQKCIDSIVEQSYSQLEIILIDDGSPDNCGIICDENAAEDTRIVVIHRENGGLSSARNAGLDIAAGEYIAFVDADDIIHPKFVEILLELCERYQCDAAQCDFLSVDKNSVRLPLTLRQSVVFYDNRQAMYELCCGRNRTQFSIAWNKIYKRKLFDEIRYPIGKIHEDEFTTYQVLWNIKKMAVTSQYLYYYLQRSDSITGGDLCRRRLDVLEAFKKRLSFLKEKELDEEYQCTLITFQDLLEKYNSRFVRTELVEEKEWIKKQLLSVTQTENKPNVDYQKLAESCRFSEGTRIVLYGAGYWGKLCYHWINKNSKGQIVGWVDNFWYTFSGMKHPITPLDSLLGMSYDYILITIKNKYVQREVSENLISWGIPEKKILFIDID